jgi:quinoprotein glucose dehydrogenase
MLILTTGFNRVIAVNPQTGKPQWEYDPKIDRTWDYGDALVNRGVAAWLDSAQNANPAKCYCFPES